MLKIILSFFVLAATVPAFAGPGSLNFSTRTDNLLQNDFGRIADIAGSIKSMSGRLAYHMYDIQLADCTLIGGCSSAVTNYVSPLALAADELAKKARYYHENTTFSRYEADMINLRTQYFNSVALHQYNLRQLIENSGAAQVGMGHGDADVYCGFMFDAYWILMNMIVDYPRAAGFGAGRGSDD